MVVLDLTNNETLFGKLRYKISNFPDGQQSIEVSLVDPRDFYNMSHSVNEGVEIKCRMNSFKEVELIVLANQALKNLGVKEINLTVPYFLGARSDRRFVSGSVNYIKDVIAPIINLQGFQKVTVVDPHSDVLEACLNNFEKISNHDLVRKSLIKYWSETNQIISDMSKVVFVSPDAGALKKVYGVSDMFTSKYDVLVCSKYRDTDGKLSKTTVPLTDDVLDKDLFIIDDICDGGGTFINIAKEIKSNEKFTGRIYLIVTHGIFSRGYEGLAEYFEKIYTTNSISDEVDENNLVTRFDVFN
jgi:ribose-phosphate pyrophosphokinase